MAILAGEWVPIMGPADPASSTPGGISWVAPIVPSRGPMAGPEPMCTTRAPTNVVRKNPRTESRDVASPLAAC